MIAVDASLTPKSSSMLCHDYKLNPEKLCTSATVPLKDIKGAKEAGMLTIFVKSQFYSRSDLDASHVKPDFTAENLKEVDKHLAEIYS